MPSQQTIQAIAEEYSTLSTKWSELSKRLQEVNDAIDQNKQRLSAVTSELLDRVGPKIPEKVYRVGPNSIVHVSFHAKSVKVLRIEEDPR
jgi:hypothetical protein